MLYYLLNSRSEVDTLDITEQNCKQWFLISLTRAMGVTLANWGKNTF